MVVRGSAPWWWWLAVVVVGVGRQWMLVKPDGVRRAACDADKQVDELGGLSSRDQDGLFPVFPLVVFVSLPSVTLPGEKSRRDAGVVDVGGRQRAEELGTGRKTRRGQASQRKRA